MFAMVRGRTCSLLMALALSWSAACAQDAERPARPGDVFGNGGSSSMPEGLDWGTCPEGFDRHCADVDVPLDWQDVEGESISVMIARHPSRSKRRGQLWLLQGGPGGSGADFLDVLEAFGAIAPDLDIYTLDHRGVGHSTRLGCAAQEEPNSDWGRSISPTEFPDCLEAVQQTWGDRLRHFNTTQAARDLAYVIEQTRGDGEQVFILGVSYGTYWALRYLQLEPDQATGVVLDSIAPPNFYISAFDTQFDPVGQSLMEACAADSACSERLGSDPWARLKSIQDLVEAGHCQETGFDKASLRSVMSAMLRSYGLREYIPALAYRIERCSAADEHAISNFYQVLLSSEDSDTLYSDVLHHHVSLSELWESPSPSLEALEGIVEASLMAPGYGPRVGAQFDIWPRYQHDEYVSEWPTTSTPMLMMNGTMDPQTPLESAEIVQQHFDGSHQHFVAMPFAAHTVFAQSPVKSTYGYPCGFQMIEGFLTDPTGPLQDACLDDLRALSFQGDATTTKLIWGVASMWDNPRKLSVAPLTMTPEGWMRRAHNLRRGR